MPDEMKGAQQSLLIALECRRDGLAAIAEKIRTALGDEGDVANTAITQIAGQMQTFLASDVLYAARVVAAASSTRSTTTKIGGQTDRHRRASCPASSGCSRPTVAAELDQQLTGGTRNDAASSRPAARHRARRR